MCFDIKVVTKEELAAMHGLGNRMVCAATIKGTDDNMYHLCYDADYNELVVAVKAEEA